MNKSRIISITLLVLFHIMIVGAFVIDAEARYGILALPFVLNGLLQALAPNSLGHYFLSIVPKERHVSGILFMNLTVGVMAGLLGIVLSSAFLKIASLLVEGEFQIFKVYYLLTIAFLLVGLIPIYRLKKI